MKKEYWKRLDSLFTENEELRSNYEDVAKVISKIVESIELEEKREELNKELQELNKED